MKQKVSLMLDSGAYSAYAKGETIDVYDYINYVKDHLDVIDSYFNLDVIPGKINQKRKDGELEAGALASRENFFEMRSHDLRPIPVFHQEEDFKWLRQMCKDVRDDPDPYIAISTLKELSLAENRAWLDQCFSYLTNPDGTTWIRVHGLGIVPFEFLKRYPWYSIDTTTWALRAAYGLIYVPIYRMGKPDYSQAPISVSVSEQETKLGGYRPDHYLHMGPMMQRRVVDFLENEVGVKLEDAAKDYEARARAIVFFNLKFAASIGVCPFRHHKHKFLA